MSNKLIDKGKKYPFAGYLDAATTCTVGKEAKFNEEMMETIHPLKWKNKFKISDVMMNDAMDGVFSSASLHRVINEWRKRNKFQLDVEASVDGEPIEASIEIEGVDT